MLKDDLKEVMKKNNWTLKSDKGFNMQFIQDERVIDIKLSFAKETNKTSKENE